MLQRKCTLVNLLDPTLEELVLHCNPCLHSAVKVEILPVMPYYHLDGALEHASKFY
jgi:hypothetical protein